LKVFAYIFHGGASQLWGHAEHIIENIINKGTQTVPKFLDVDFHDDREDPLDLPT
jgi:hypothetical protein